MFYMNDDFSSIAELSCLRCSSTIGDTDAGSFEYIASILSNRIILDAYNPTWISDSRTAQNTDARSVDGRNASISRTGKMEFNRR